MKQEKQPLLLKAVPRDLKEQSAALVQQGYVPAELYGHGMTNQHLKIPYNDFAGVFTSAGESALVDVVVDDQKPVKVLIKEVQIDPVKDTFVHADLYHIRMDEEITTDIPLYFVGESPAVKEKGGILVKHTDKIEVRCLPKDLVHEIEVDITLLKEFGDAFLVEDLVIPKGIHILVDGKVNVISVAEPRKMEEKEVSAEEPAEEKEIAEGEASAEEKKDKGEPASPEEHKGA